MSKLTPAEKLAKEKQRTRPKRNYPAKSEKILWSNRLAEMREKLNLSQRDVAAAAGLSVSAYFRIEKGFADVSLSNAYSIAVLFGKSVYEIWWQWRGTTSRPG